MMTSQLVLENRSCFSVAIFHKGGTGGSLAKTITLPGRPVGWPLGNPLDGALTTDLSENSETSSVQQLYPCLLYIHNVLDHLLVWTEERFKFKAI